MLGMSLSRQLVTMSQHVPSAVGHVGQDSCNVNIVS